MNFNDLNAEERSNIIKKLIDTEVKVQFSSGVIIGFNPFSICASMPPQYRIKNYTSGKNMEFMFVDKLKFEIENNGIETNNIKYLKEKNFKTIHMTLNTEL